MFCSTRFVHGFRIGLFALAALGPIGFTTGCHTEGGPMWSADRYTYVSRTWEPKTVSVIDTRTGESIWSVDIPVGQKLSVGFSKGTGPNEYKPDEIVWEVIPEDRTFATRSNRQPCPPAHARRIEMHIRATPELPGAEMPGSPYGTTAPAYTPVKHTNGAPPPAPESDEPIVPAPGAEPPPPMDEPAVPAPQPTPDAPAAPPPAAEPPPAEDPPIDLPGQGTVKPK